MLGQRALYEKLKELSISFEYYEHPPLATISEAKIHWENLDSGKCKNIFVRNHKGNRHYLIILEHLRQVNMQDLEKRLKQGKLSFASDQRLKKYLGVVPGSVSPFGLINDKEQHVHLFIDESLEHYNRLLFHPNINTATLAISKDDFIRFLQASGNSFQFIKLYNE
jgi:Ala-tRNA(Pro) deacylase